MKENQTGPSVYTRYVEEEKAPVDHYSIDNLPEFGLDEISTKNADLQNELIKEFSLSGETFYHRV